mgnify:CR=1 FL=1
MFNEQFHNKPIQKRESNGCKIKVKRDQQGRITGYEDNGMCQKGQISAFTDKLDFDDKIEQEEE